MYGAERLTRDYILSILSQTEIMEYYLGIPVQFKTHFCSPLRVDKKPTCTFSVDRRGVLILKDFNGSFYGDCFNVVEKVCGIVGDLSEVLRQIASDFQLRDTVRREQPKQEILVPTTSPKLIEIKTQPWTPEDIAYWKSFGITGKTLNHYKVTSIAHAWINDRLVYSYSKRDIGYGYGFGNGKYKLYFPLRNTYRFLSNASILQGLSQLPGNGSLLVLTKSLKDVMLLYQYGISAVALSSETASLEVADYEELASRFTTIVSLYDFDYAGVRGARKLRTTYNIYPLFLTNGRFGTVNYQAKDLSDFRKHFGEEATSSLIYSLLEWQKQANAYC